MHTRFLALARVGHPSVGRCARVAQEGRPVQAPAGSGAPGGAQAAGRPMPQAAPPSQRPLQLPTQARTPRLRQSERRPRRRRLDAAHDRRSPRPQRHRPLADQHSPRVCRRRDRRRSSGSSSCSSPHRAGCRSSIRRPTSITSRPRRAARKTACGCRTRKQTVLEDFKRLWATNFLDNLSIEVKDAPYDNGVIGKHVIYTLEERQRVKIVDYTGSKKVDQTKIDEKLKEENISIRLDSFIDPAPDPQGRGRRARAAVREGLPVRGGDPRDQADARRAEAGAPVVRDERRPEGADPRDRVRREQGRQRRDAARSR